jgi:NAD(P)-dependent dehydrogenase (short-subunit alcohol dehydrogenase family)
MSVGIVVGATGGIGSACARALAGSTDTLVLVGRQADALASLAAELHGDVALVEADLTSAAGRDSIAAATSGDLRWLVIASGMPIRGELRELDDAQIEAAFATNLVGPTLLIKQLLPRLARGGAVTLIGSISATRALPRRSVYGATKAGVEHLTRSLAAELAPAGIRVKFVGEDRRALEEWVAERVPAARVGRPEEVANVVRYVTLEAPEYLTGARIAVDGGTEAQA